MTDAKNVIPQSEGYIPFKLINPFSDALTARCQGAWATKDNSATVHVYAGDVAKLYLLGTDGQWDDATRSSGGAYACPADNQWRFIKFGAVAIGVNGADVPQSITLSGGTNFAALAGSPPTSKHIAVIREFVVMGNITSAQNRVQWSASNNSIVWTTGTNEANQQDIPDGGVVQALIGGEVGYVFQERQIVRMVRVPAPITFQFDVVEQSRGALCPYAVVPVGGGVFYIAHDGFYLFNGAESIPIGENGVDRTFLNEVNSANYGRVTAAVDPLRKLVYVAYPTGGGGQPNKILVWHWPSKRWAYSDQDCEILFQYFTLGQTLDGLDALGYTNIDTMTLSLDSAAFQGGNQALGVFNSAHKLSFFDGMTMEATMVTGEGQLSEGRTQVQEVTPLIDTTAATVAMGVRETQPGTVVYGSASSQRSTGICPVRSTGRFHRAKVTVPAGSTWTYAQGVDIVRAASAGRR